MATDILADAQAYVLALNDAGIRATLNPADLNPPAVLIRMPVLHFRFGRGCIAADWEARLYLIDNGVEQAMKTGIPMITDIQNAMGWPVVDAVPRDWLLPDGGLSLGFEFTWTTHPSDRRPANVGYGRGAYGHTPYGGSGNV